MSEKKELRNYQKNIVEKVLESDRDIIICLPTAAGKTVVASNLIAKISNKVIFIVPRLELITQAKQEIGDVDIIWSDSTSLEGKHCIIASKDSLRTQYDKLPENIKEEIRNGTIIIDEVHYGLEQSYNLVHKLKPSRVLGLTATPERMDGQALLKGEDEIHKYGIFDELLQEETVASLIRKGYLAKLRYYARPISGISEIKPDNKKGLELSGNQMVKIFNENGIWGDLVQSYEEYGKGRPALGFTTTVEMGEQVAKIFVDAGYDFRVIHGKMSLKEREQLIDKLANHEIDGLVNAALLTYGFNCPPVSYAFNCRHIKSRPLWFQIVGRILRKCEGKTDAIFVDHADCISEFSEPDCSLPILDETIQWKVDGETKEMQQQRKAARKKVQKTMELIQALDPMPAKLVEITVENTWERLVRIILKLQSENAILIKDKENLEQDNIQLAEKLENINQQAMEVKDRYIRATQKAQSLMAENEELKKNPPAKKIIDADQTFDYIRRHYIPYRRYTEENHPGLSRQEAHSLTVKQLQTDEKNLPFIYDRMKFERSVNWWFNNYEKRIGQ